MLNQQKQKEEDPVGIRTETIRSISRSYSFPPFLDFFRAKPAPHGVPHKSMKPPLDFRFRH
jgi:hypothetical protein